MRKKLLLSFLLVLVSSVFASELSLINLAASFPKSSTIYPSNDNFDNIIDISSDEDIFDFSNQLKKDFSIEWCDENFDKSSRKSLAQVLSDILSTLLPANNVIFSAPVILYGGEKSFRFKNIDTGKVYTVILRNKKILSLTEVV